MEPLPAGRCLSDMMRTRARLAPDFDLCVPYPMTKAIEMMDTDGHCT